MLPDALLSAALLVDYLLKMQGDILTCRSPVSYIARKWHSLYWRNVKIDV